MKLAMVPVLGGALEVKLKSKLSKKCLQGCVRCACFVMAKLTPIRIFSCINLYSICLQESRHIHLIAMIQL